MRSSHRYTVLRNNEELENFIKGLDFILKRPSGGSSHFKIIDPIAGRGFSFFKHNDHWGKNVSGRFRKDLFKLLKMRCN